LRSANSPWGRGDCGRPIAHSGPYREVDVPGGGKAPFYVIPFDEDGVCTGPVTRQHLLGGTVGHGSYTDLLFHKFHSMEP